MGVRGGTSQCLSLIAKGSGSAAGVVGEGLGVTLRCLVCRDALACRRASGVNSAGTSPWAGSSSNMVGSVVQERWWSRGGRVKGLNSPLTELGEVVICRGRLGVDPDVPGGPRSGELGLPSLGTSRLGTLGLWQPELERGEVILETLSTNGFDSLRFELEFSTEFSESPRLGKLGIPSLGTSFEL